MAGGYSEPVDWPGAGWALTVWAVHFTILWSASSVYPGDAAARWIAMGATITAFAALLWLWRARRIAQVRSIPALAVAMAALAIAFGALPAVLG